MPEENNIRNSFYYVGDFLIRGVYSKEDYDNKKNIRFGKEFGTEIEAATYFIENNYAYHFTSIDNIKSILDHGLLSHKRKEELGIDHFDVANNDIQNRRETMEIPDSGGKTVHDYVPFYFAKRTPMLLNVINRRIVDQRDIVFIVVKLTILNRDGALFTDASANTNNRPHFYPNIQDLFHLKWDIINSARWSYDDSERKQKMAEVLIPDQVLLEDIDHFIVFDDAAKKNFQDILSKAKCEKKVEIGDKFSYYYKLFEGRKEESLVTGPKELLELCKTVIEEITTYKKSNVTKRRFKDIYELEDTQHDIFESISELRDIVGLESKNKMHEHTVDIHTQEVVSLLEEEELFNGLGKEKQTILRLAAYFHDIGKGPKSKWKDDIQEVYVDHPVDSLTMLKRILTEEIENISEYQIKMICVLVAYHDLLGLIYKEKENERRSEGEFEVIKEEFQLDLDDVKMLFVLSLSDAKSVEPKWRDKLYSYKDKIIPEGTK